MKILRKPIKDDKYFKCPSPCNTIFTANKTEYHGYCYYPLSGVEVTVFYCRCPVCGGMAMEISKNEADAELAKGGTV